jgi:hypothetical protein
MPRTNTIAVTAMALIVVAMWTAGRPSEARHADMQRLDVERATLHPGEGVQSARREESIDLTSQGGMNSSPDQPIARRSLPPISPDATPVIWKGQTYWYDDGLWYDQQPTEWRAVAAPTGAVVQKLPSTHATLQIDGRTYYAAYGVYYVAVPMGYAVADAPR